MIKLMLQLYRQSWYLVALAMLGGIVSGSSGAALVAMIGQAIERRDATLATALAFGGMCLLHLMSKVASELALLRVSQDMILKLRISLSQKVLSTPLKKLQSYGPARLLAILTDDLSTFASCSQMLPVLFGNAVVLLACLAYLAWISMGIFLVLVVLLVAGGVLFVVAQRKPALQFVRVREQTDVLFRDYRNLLEGTKELQLDPKRARHFVNEVLQPGAARLRNGLIAGGSGYTWIGNLGSLQFFIALGVVVFGIPHWVPSSAPALPMAALMLLYMVEPVSSLLTAMPTLQRASIALNNAQALDGSLDGPHELVSDAGASTFDGNVGGLMLHDVRYVHHDGDRDFSVGPINISIPLGKITYIAGPNGSGKTTLALLLLGLYAAEEGHIELNGAAVTPANLLAYRSQFAAVFADFHLFEQLLSPIDEDAAVRTQRYLERLEIAHKVKVKDGRFSTLALSTGQRKRLALLVAYLEDRPIYLFDEWASDQDPVFKRLFYTELLPDLRSRGKTVIVITHDDQYFDQADQLLYFVDGNLRIKEIS